MGCLALELGLASKLILFPFEVALTDVVQISIFDLPGAKA